MKHFLITRFNLKNKHWQNDNDKYEVLSKEWLDDRFYLFENFCLPSVKNQINKNFTWFVFFDIDTPDAYLKRIHAVANEFANFRPIFIDGFDNLQLSLENQIKKEMTFSDNYFITTRLDNDDIIHENFIETIQDLYVAKDRTVIDLRLGYQAILFNSFIEFRIYKIAFNPFVSLISSVDSFETVISKEHSYWKICPNQLVNTKSFMWIQLIHDKNKLNQKLVALKKTNKINLKEFGIELPKSSTSSFQILIYNLLMFPYRIYFNLKTKIR